MNNDNDARRGGGGFVAGFLMGALTGAALAMMVAPQTGEETRDLVFGKAREAGTVAKDATGDLRGKVTNIASDLQISASDLYSRGKQVVDAARSGMGAAVDEGRTAAGTARTDLLQQAGPSNVPEI